MLVSYSLFLWLSCLLPFLLWVQHSAWYTGRAHVYLLSKWVDDFQSSETKPSSSNGLCVCLCLGLLVCAVDLDCSDTLSWAGIGRYKDAGKQMLLCTRKWLSARSMYKSDCSVWSQSRYMHITLLKICWIKSPKPKRVTVIPDSNWIPVSRQIICKSWAHLSLGSKHHRKLFAFPPDSAPWSLHSSLCVANHTSNAIK